MIGVVVEEVEHTFNLDFDEVCATIDKQLDEGHFQLKLKDDELLLLHDLRKGILVRRVV